MVYNRRQFLILTGGLVGVTLATASHKLFSQSQPNDSQDIAVNPPNYLRLINRLLLPLMAYMHLLKRMLELSLLVI